MIFWYDVIYTRHTYVIPASSKNHVPQKVPSPATPCNSCSRAQTRPRNALRGRKQCQQMSCSHLWPLIEWGNNCLFTNFKQKENPSGWDNEGGDVAHLAKQKLPFRCGKVVNSLNSPPTWVNPSSSTGTAERAKGRNLHPQKIGRSF